jgi:uncharacterized lipoprotein YmbA
MKHKLNYIIYIATLCILSACSTSPDLLKYYALENNNPATISNHNKDLVYINTTNIKLPSYLDTNSIIFKKSNYEILKTNKNKWVDSTSVILNKTLTEFMYKNNPILNVKHCTNNHNCYYLKLLVDDFSASYKGYTNVSLYWFLEDDNNNVICENFIENKENITHEGYEWIVDSLNTSWFKSLNFLTQEIKQCINENN